MPIKQVTITVLICPRCQHEWVPRPLNRLELDPTNLPKFCPACKQFCQWEKEGKP